MTDFDPQAEALRAVAESIKFASQDVSFTPQTIKVNGEDRIMLAIERASDTTYVCLKPKNLFDIGQAMMKCAREVMSGLTVVERDKPVIPKFLRNN